MEQWIVDFRVFGRIVSSSTTVGDGLGREVMIPLPGRFGVPPDVADRAALLLSGGSEK